MGSTVLGLLELRLQLPQSLVLNRSVVTLTGEVQRGREVIAYSGTMQELLGLPRHIGCQGPLRGHLADSSQARSLLERG